MHTTSRMSCSDGGGGGNSTSTSTLPHSGSGRSFSLLAPDVQRGMAAAAPLAVSRSCSAPCPRTVRRRRGAFESSAVRLPLVVST